MRIAFSAYELYRDSEDSNTSGMSRHSSSGNHSNEDDLCKHFKDTFSRNVGIHFIGAWYVLRSILIKSMT